MNKVKYNPHEIEKKWQKNWADTGLYNSDLESPNKFYVLAEFAYPSGDLHTGHWFTFCGADIFARFKRMQGFNVFFPNGFDAFGLPAENAAIKRNVHPMDWTMSNIDKMKKQFETMGASFTFDHQVTTCLPEYYRWNQWLFLKMFEKGLAYRAKFLSNWCPVDQTVLANEAIEGGKCWRCGSEVVQKEVEQWFFKITDYADRLIWPENPKVNWPKPVRDAQNDWIGRSEGLIFTAPVKDSELKIQTFSAHFEAFCADTFVVIAPDHPLLSELIKDVENKKEILDFANKIVNNRKANDYSQVKEIEGIFTGKYIVDPIGNGNLPIWVASFALRDYGTGIVKCSAHDDRDFAFAKKYGIRLKPVLFPEDQKLRDKVEKVEICFTDMNNGVLSEPKEFAGMKAGKVRDQIIDYLTKKGLAESKTQYHIHDWSVSRQRYWGTPVPIIHCPKCGMVPVPEDQLPVELPYEVDYTPKGKPPLATNEAWLNVKCPKCGEDAKREAETMDTFVDSSWYFFRFLDPKLDTAAFDPELAKKIMPVDIYFGGSEHTLGHTLYSRFITKVFADLGLTDLSEFALRRINHGTVLGPDGNRMSKSKGNVVNPDVEVQKYGVDAIRIFLAFFMPYEGTGPWVSDRIWGPYRFLERVWGLVDKVSEIKLSEQDLVEMNSTIKQVSEDMEEIKFNTVVSSLMKWLNYLSARENISQDELIIFIKLLSPFAPHLTEEIWHNSGNLASIHNQSWPEYDSNHIEGAIIKIVVQINGKVRGTISVEKNKSQDKEYIEKLVREDKKLNSLISEKSVKNTVYIPGKIINFVIG